MKIMKKSILFILTSLGGGGAEKVFIDLLRNFDYSQYQITLLLVYGAGVHLNNVPKGVEILSIFHRKQHQLDISTELYLRSIYHKLLKYKVSKLFKNRYFDTVISYTEGFPLLIQSFLPFSPKKRIAWVHIDLATSHWCWWHFLSKQQEELLYRKMDEIVFVSKKAKEQFSVFFGITKRLKVIYNVIDRDEIIRLSKLENIGKSKFTIINIGRLHPQKRQDRIIKIAKILKNRNIDFEIRILGTGQLENQLKVMAQDKGVDDVVKFLGFKDNPYPYIAASDCFLLTSDTEGYPTVVCEALCLGIPVISTNITGSDELLGDGTGILTSFDEKEIADKIELLVNNRDLYQQFVDSSNRKACQFNPREVLNNVYDIIKK